jgi:septal ring factor EnvC (AmiA/AmiB activator)
LDDLATENSGLKAKVAELNDEIARLKAESSEAHERAKKDRQDAESREGELHQRLQSSLDTLCSKPSALFLSGFAALTNLFS